MNSKLQALASLITIRNHILIVLNDANVTGKNDYRPLDAKRKEIDKLFVKTLLETDITLEQESLTDINLDKWRSTFETSLKDPDFKVFTQCVAADIEKFTATESLSVTDSVLTNELLEVTEALTTVASAVVSTDDSIAAQEPVPDAPKTKAITKAADNSLSLSEDPEFKKRLAEEKSNVKKRKSK